MKLRKRKSKNRIKDEICFAENEPLEVNEPLEETAHTENIASEEVDAKEVSVDGFVNAEESENENLAEDMPPEDSGEGVAVFEDRPRKGKKGKKNRKKRKKKMSLLSKLLIFLLAVGAVLLIASTSYFDVSKYEVEGSTYYSAEEIVIMGDCKTGKNIFWGSDLKDIETRLVQDPYIEEAKTKRLLPDRVLIEVKERRQMAAVVYGDNYVVIDGDGLVLRNTKVEPQVTLIQGVTISKIEVGQPIEIEEKVKFRQIMEMIGVMDASDMYFSKIVATKAGVNAYVLEHLVCEGSPQNIMASMQNQNLQKVVQGLFDLKIERGTIKISGGEYISFNPAVD